MAVLLLVWLSLQAWPNPVFEGDTLTLRCQGMKYVTLNHVKFFKDGKLLHLSEDNQPLSVGVGTVSSSGQYSCTGVVTYFPQMVTQTSRTVTVQVQELFLPPVLRAVPSPKPREGSPLTLSCQTELHPRRSASRLLFSFHKDGRALQDRDLRPELRIPAAGAGDSGLFWCEVASEDGRVQKRSPQLEIRVGAPVSRPLLTLRPRPPGLTVGSTVELLCEAQGGSPPILYSFYLDGEILGNRSAPHGGAASLVLLVTSEKDAGNYTCEAENRVSRERSQPEILSLDGPRVSPSPTHSNWLASWLPASLLGVMATAAALLGYFRPWRKTGPLSPPSPPPAPGGEQHPLRADVRYRNEKDEGVIYCVVHAVPKAEARPAESASGETDTPVIYAEVKCPQPGEVPAEGLNISGRSHKDPLGDCKEVLTSDGVPSAQHPSTASSAPQEARGAPAHPGGPPAP